MTPQQQKTVCALDSTAEGLLQMAMDELQLSARAIADLTAQEAISPEHIGEAIQYRTLDRKLWA
jgi:magnesium chelatase family protein